MKKVNEEVVDVLVKGVRNRTFLAEAILVLTDVNLERRQPETHLQSLAEKMAQSIPRNNTLSTLGRDVATIVRVALDFDVRLGKKRSEALSFRIKESHLLSELVSWYLFLIEKNSPHASTFGLGVFIGTLDRLADDSEHEKGDGWQLWLETLAEGLLKFAELLLFSDQPLGSLSPAVSGLLSNSVAKAVKNEDCLKVFVRQFLHLFWSKMSPAVNTCIVSEPVLLVVNEFLAKGWNQADPFQKAFALETALDGDPNLRKQV